MGCHVRLDEVFDRRAALRYACRVRSWEANEERWWGDQPEPAAFTMKVGDCLRLEAYLYCVEEIEPRKSVSFRSRYLSFPDTSYFLKRLKDTK
jgi:hypothetical protein